MIMEMAGKTSHSKHIRAADKAEDDAVKHPDVKTGGDDWEKAEQPGCDLGVRTGGPAAL
jgi:hypothetical protein